MADLPKHKPNVIPGIEDWLRHHPELAENERLQARVEALERALREADDLLRRWIIEQADTWHALLEDTDNWRAAARKLLEKGSKDNG